MRGSFVQYVKCGFAGENFPTSVFPCVVGRPLLRYDESLIEQELKVILMVWLIIFILKASNRIFETNEY